MKQNKRKSYLKDYRKRTIEYREEGHTLEETQKVFRVAIGTIRAWENNGKRRIPQRDCQRIRLLRDSNTQSVWPVGHYLLKKTIYYREQDPEKVKIYQEEIAGAAPEQSAYVDETGIDTYLYREYGYAHKGHKISAAARRRKYKRVWIVAAQRGKEIILPLAYTGTMDCSLFEFWFEKQPLPALSSDAVIVIDNASFHRRAQLINVAQKQGFRLTFLPSCSPKFNPIENFWGWLNCYLTIS